MTQRYTADSDSEFPPYNVVAYITAYQDRVALIKCIQAIRSQSYPIGQIVVVDNSPSPLITGKDDILVWSYPKNIGISGGLSRLIQWTEHKGYDFVWMFDQDSEPAPTCLGQLIWAYTQLTVHHPIGIVAPVSTDPRTKLVIKPARFTNDRFEGADLPRDGQPYECDSPITSGSLLSLETVVTVPPPDIRLFIDGIDLEYGLRLKQAGYKNFLVSQAAMSHNFGDPTEIKFLGKTKLLQVYSALRYYYICRNHTYLELRFSQGVYKLTCMLRRIKFLGSQMFWIWIMETENKHQKIRACLRGTYHGFLGDLDQPF